MRKTIFFSFIVLGTAVGLLASLSEEWPTRIVVMFLGALVGIAIGGGLSRVRRQRSTGTVAEVPPGDGTASKDLAANFWRDRGHAPFMKPPNAEPGRKMFDPDQLD